MAATVDYVKARAAFDGYKAIKYSRKYMRNMKPILTISCPDGHAGKQGNGAIAT